MPAPAGDGPGPLVQRIRDEIRSSGPLSFARFMELALFDPEHGYYSAGPDRLGRQGDFFTASDVGHAFGRCMARQVAEIERSAGPFDPFHVIEFGAGRGLLARDLLDALSELNPELSAKLRYRMVDRSAAMRSAARAMVPEADAVSPNELGTGHRGCVLAVELFDALPVRRVRRKGGRLVEVRVGADAAGALQEVETDPEPEVETWAERYGAAAEEGTEAEVSLGAAAMLDTMESALEAGVLIIVDYGHPAAELYDIRRRRGTLLAYHGHAANEDFLARVGEQDLTAHVNFTALEDRARERGLTVLGLTTQDRFLVSNGILELFEQETAEQVYAPRRVKMRMQAMQLIHPMSMGRTFKVLILAKGIDPPPRLAGLADPFATGRPGEGE